MLFVIECRDRPGALELRLQTRPAHLDYLASLGDRVVLAGPFLGANEKPTGSMIVVKAETMAEAEDMAARDPYVAAGLFVSTEIRAWSWAVNKPEGF